MKPTHNCRKCGTDFNKTELKKIITAYNDKCPVCNSTFLHEYKEESK